jgi:transposase InsO family protein
VLSRLAEENHFVSDKNGEEAGQICNIVENVEETTNLTSKTLIQQTMKDALLSRVIFYTQKGWPAEKEKVPVDVRPYYERRNELSFERKILLCQNRIVIPEKLRKNVLTELHLAHFGISSMRHQASATVWWPKINADIEQFVKECKSCQKFQNMVPQNPILPWPTPDAPWERLHLDFAGPFQNKHWLVIIDAYSRWLDIIPVRHANSVSVIEALRSLFSTYGLCQRIVTDNGTPFVSAVFQQFLDENGIHHIRSTPYHSRTNGMAERPIQTFKKHYLRSVVSIPDENHCLAAFLFAYRRRIHVSTGRSPFELMFGRIMRSRLQALGAEDREVAKTAALKQKVTFDGLRRPRNFEEGDKVWVAPTPAKVGWTAGEVVRKKGPLSYDVEMEGNIIRRKHADHLRVDRPKRMNVRRPARYL